MAWLPLLAFAIVGLAALVILFDPFEVSSLWRALRDAQAEAKAEKLVADVRRRKGPQG